MMPAWIIRSLIVLAKLVMLFLLFAMSHSLILYLLESYLAAIEGPHSLPHDRGITVHYSVKLMTWILLLYPFGHLAWYLL